MEIKEVVQTVGNEKDLAHILQEKIRFIRKYSDLD